MSSAGRLRLGLEETRGGEYFFIPSLTALRQIAEGSVDPT
jgi:hypothetical protein